MREILGRRRKLSLRRDGRSAALTAALGYATQWQWPVLPGAGLRSDGGRATECACRHLDCAAPGAHPFEPGLLAATTDARMVQWWWTNRPDAPVVLATGGRAPCAVSLPAVAGARALATFDRAGVRLGPVVATPTRWALLVAPYSLEVLGELLHSQDWVPGSLRFHGEGGYVALPPSSTGAGRVRWERAPGAAVPARTDRPSRLGRALSAAGAVAATPPWLPDVATVVDVLVEESAGTGTAGGGSRLAY
ncbi:bifunctional DNA primase/polymerase [Streptomyces sp. ISL-11]|uniref:bifunctional DNA primase/polymerase n=1 Tax=Streptomyces sp. ISL-11 TaxID=2819174 RepID=UPI001BEB0399|nr:bifunctional DNA primase/polymerase [Streptomyces sp. ISL-11]MBT2382861.1 bifunctional DNA primase/polymerase [Streptomyces sp. ISL-11]